MYDTQTQMFEANAADKVIFKGDVALAKHNQVLVQVSFKGGATGSVALKARLTEYHDAVVQMVIEEDSIVRLALCPEILADITVAGGSVVISSLAS